MDELLWRKAGGLMLDLLYPPHCPVCDKIVPINGRRICSPCMERLPRIRQPFCMRCGKMIGRWEEEYCEDCRKYPHFYQEGRAAFQYNGMMHHSLGRIKEGNRREYLTCYAGFLAEILEEVRDRWQPEVLIPVPMHPGAKQKRGYNQAEILAKELGRLSGIPVLTDAVRKTKRTEAQKEMGRKERLFNLRGSFQPGRSLAPYRSVLIVDDVYTTGSTVDEISRILLQQGVRSVYFLTICIGKGKKLL